MVENSLRQWRDMSFFSKIKELPDLAVELAPLAGVSDSAFRLMCQLGGADLCYVEMLSAKALIYRNQNTLRMLKRHPLEKNLGVQLTGSSPEDMGQAVSFLNKFNFSTIDINMGCPVRKVVKSGCGSAILQNIEQVYRITEAAVKNASVPVSVKIRLGWDESSLNYLEVADAIERAGASWITVHGRTRSQNYSAPVDLNAIEKIKKQLSIPVLGNGNIFSSQDVIHMRAKTKVDGVMISRGALGNPWIFNEIKGYHNHLSLENWLSSIKKHILFHKENYREEKTGVLCFRKHLLWYLKGWHKACSIKDAILKVLTYDELLDIVEKYAEYLREKGISSRLSLCDFTNANKERYSWSSKVEIPIEDYKLNLPFIS